MSESVLLIGSGGREHALATEMVHSPDLDYLYCAPGNPGTETLPRTENMHFGAGDYEAIASFARGAREGGEALTVVIGPEAPLVDGLADQLRADDIAVFGPSAAAAQLEGRKTFADTFMSRCGIPCPEGVQTRTMDEAMLVIDSRDAEQLVLKADGLAGGKGVVLPKDRQEAEAVLQAMFSGEGYSGAGRGGVLIQERLTGPEVSAFMVSDGTRASLIPVLSQDHKRRDNGDAGPNTGGMGAYTLPSGEVVNDKQLAQIEAIGQATIEGMRHHGMPYQGVLYLGMMLARERDGDPVVIEYNSRFGDPEAQVVLPTLTDAGIDVYQLLAETARGRVPDLPSMQLAGRSALTVCLAAEGYPESPVKGAVIHGLETAYPNTTIYHGGTKYRDGQLVANGGRVLYVTGRGETVDAAAAAAYGAIGEWGIHFDGMHHRTDIGGQVRSTVA